MFARDEIIADQHRNDFCDILRLSFAVERYALFDVVLGLLRGEVVLEARSNDPGRNAIDSDVIVGELARQ